MIKTKLTFLFIPPLFQKTIVSSNKQTCWRNRCLRRVYSKVETHILWKETMFQEIWVPRNKFNLNPIFWSNNLDCMNLELPSLLGTQIIVSIAPAWKWKKSLSRSWKLKPPTMNHTVVSGGRDRLKLGLETFLFPSSWLCWTFSLVNSKANLDLKIQFKTVASGSGSSWKRSNTISTETNHVQ